MEINGINEEGIGWSLLLAIHTSVFLKTGRRKTAHRNHH